MYLVYILGALQRNYCLVFSSLQQNGENQYFVEGSCTNIHAWAALIVPAVTNCRLFWTTVLVDSVRGKKKGRREEGRETRKKGKMGGRQEREQNAGGSKWQSLWLDVHQWSHQILNLPDEYLKHKIHISLQWHVFCFSFSWSGESLAWEYASYFVFIVLNTFQWKCPNTKYSFQDNQFESPKPCPKNSTIGDNIYGK